MKKNMLDPSIQLIKLVYLNFFLILSKARSCKRVTGFIIFLLTKGYQYINILIVKFMTLWLVSFPSVLKVFVYGKIILKEIHVSHWSKRQIEIAY